MTTNKTPQKKAEQKVRTAKNKLKPPKKRQFASEAIKARKLKVKEEKRKRYLVIK